MSEITQCPDTEEIPPAKGGYLGFTFKCKCGRRRVNPNHFDIQPCGMDKYQAYRVRASFGPCECGSKDQVYRAGYYEIRCGERFKLFCERDKAEDEFTKEARYDRICGSCNMRKFGCKRRSTEEEETEQEYFDRIWNVKKRPVMARN